MRQSTEEDLFSREMLEHLCETYPEEIVAISAAETVDSGQLTLGTRYANVDIQGVSDGYFLAEAVELTAGRFFTEKESENRSLVALISSKAADKLFPDDPEAAIGAVLPLSIGEVYREATVVGVYKYDQSDFGIIAVSEEEASTGLYIPLRTAQSITHSQGYPSFTVVVDSTVNADSFATQITDLLSAFYRNNRYFEPSAFSMSSLVESLTSVMSTITTAISVIAGIALLVGGIGVMNIMLVSITERTREIGTRKALGAPNSAIRMQFIIEAIVICLIGGIIGIVLGIALGALASNLLLHAPAKASPSSIVLSLLFSMAIGIFFGYYPANKAAKMDPIDALRYE